MGKIIGPLPRGKTCTVIDEQRTEAGTVIEHFTTDADALLVSVWARTTAGDISVVVTTFDERGQELDVITFPLISAPSTELFLKKTASVLSNIKVTATCTGAADFRVTVRGLGQGSGDTSVKIEGYDNASANSVTITTGAPQILIPSGLVDRDGVNIRNWDQGTNILYLGFTIASATATTGWPMLPGEGLGVDLKAGVTIYAVAVGGSIDVRTLEAGG